MSQFEYVSVAVALVFTLAVGRTLAGVQDAVAGERRDLVHLGWVAHLLFSSVAQWWLLWSTNETSWNGLRFLWVLALPTIQYLRAVVLLGDGATIESYRDHFYRVRRPYFTLVGLVSLHVGLTPWVLGLVPWLAPTPVHAFALLIAGVALAGFVSRSERVHTILVLIALAILTATYFGMTPLLSAA